MDTKLLPIHERIKELRDSQGWTQNELGDRLGTDGRMISHYENGKNIPSAEVLVRIAELFDVSIDYLLIEDATRKPLKQIEDNDLAEQFMEASKLPSKDRDMIKYMINSVITKNKVKDLASSAV